MPKILIVAATPFEIANVAKHFKVPINDTSGLFISENNLSVLVTGVGMVNTAYCMGRFLNDNFDYVVNAGICGSFNPKLKIGEVVNVISDALSELGAEDHEDFIPFADLNLGGTTVYFPRNDFHGFPLSEAKQVSSITVNKVHGNEESIKKIIGLYNPDVESMEGAAFFRGCEHLKSNSFQIRAVSNLVEKRDKNKWDIPLAIANLNNFIIQFANTINP